MCVISFKGSRWQQILYNRFHNKLIQLRCLVFILTEVHVPSLVQVLSPIMTAKHAQQSVLTTVSPLFSPTGFFEMKMKYDESDNAVIRASRAVTDKVTDFLGNAPPSTMILLLQIVLVVELKTMKEESLTVEGTKNVLI